MNSLAERARSYLEAAGFALVRSDARLIQFARPEGRGTSERILLWADDAARLPSGELDSARRAERDAAEGALLSSFERELRAAPGAAGYYLVERRIGLSQEFVIEATRLLGARGGIRVPVEFFDTAYKIESTEARRARSVLGDTLALAGKVRRVAQPFSVRNRLAGEARAQPGCDLVEHLETAMLDRAPGAKLRLIDGAAGSGKTIAFNALAAALHGEFVAAKRARVERARPIVFLPEHIRGRRAGYVDDILAAVAETDVAELTSPDQLKWLLKNGHSIWMFDGLDEFYAGSSDFFTFVEEALTAPGSRAQFIICTRDSLSSSSPIVQDFIARRLAAGNDTEIYDLRPWTAESWKELAWLELEDGREDARSSSQVERFVSTLNGSVEIAALAQLPFYCSVLLSHFKNNGSVPQDALDVLELLVTRMIAREHDKRIFQWQDFIDVGALQRALEEELPGLNHAAANGGLGAAIRRLLDEEALELMFELVGALAHRLQRTPDAFEAGSGLSADDVRDLLSVSGGSAGAEHAALQRLRIALVRFAFFGPGRRAGSIDFTHVIIADYFAARCAATMLDRALADHDAASADSAKLNGELPALASAVARALGTAPVVPRSIFHHYLARKIAGAPKLRRNLELALEHGNIGPGNVSDGLQLLLGTTPHHAKRHHLTAPALEGSPAETISSPT